MKAPLVIAASPNNNVATKITTFVASLFVSLVLGALVFAGLYLIKLDPWIARTIVMALVAIGTMYLFFKADQGNKVDQALFEKVKDRVFVVDSDGLKIFRDYVSPASTLKMMGWRNSSLLNSEGVLELTWSEIHSIATTIGNGDVNTHYFRVVTAKGDFLIPQEFFHKNQSELISYFQDYGKWQDSL